MNTVDGQAGFVQNASNGQTRDRCRPVLPTCDLEIATILRYVHVETTPDLDVRWDHLLERLAGDSA